MLMDQSYEHLRGHALGNGALHWTPAKPSASYTTQQSNANLNDLIHPVQGEIGAIAYSIPIENDHPLSLPSISPTHTVPILPSPYQILKSQSSPKSCMVCRRLNCTLVSHKHFADDRKSGRDLRRRRKSESGSHITSPPVTPKATRFNNDFVDYPVIMDSERQRLLALWSQEWGRIKPGPERHLFPRRWIDLLLPAALRHAPLFEALLAMSGSYTALASKVKDDAGDRHMQLAEQLLSQADSHTATTDECILTSILVTNVHLARGKAFEVERQFAVLVHVVGMRGGPHYLGVSGMAAELLLHIDQKQAVFFDREPIFRMPLPVLDVGIRPRLGRSFREMLSSTDIDPDLLLAADSLCRAADVFQMPLVGDTSSASKMNAFGYLSSISEFQLARCNNKFHGSNTWTECICLALILFNSVVLRNHGFFDVPSQKIEHRFWESLDHTIARNGFRGIPPCLLLWILMTGLTPCLYSDCKYRTNAIEKMRAAKIGASINGWEQFCVDVLDAHLWVKVVQGEIFQLIWHDVEGVKAVVGSSITRDA